MPSLALRQLLVRSAAAAAASILALGSTASLVAVASSGPSATGTPLVQSDNSGPSVTGKDGSPGSSPSPISTGGGVVKPSPTSAGSGDGSGTGGGIRTGKGTGKGTGTIAALPMPAVAPVGRSTPGDTTPVAAGDGTEATPVHEHVVPEAVAAVHSAPRAVTASTASAHVVVNDADPAPFATTSIAALDVSARVLPTESLGPLSGISFGGGLLIWPLLLAINALALGAIARMALRRRPTSPGD
jgi:hypothetical protein